MLLIMLQLKQEFAGELICLEEALKQEKEHMQKETNRLKAELQEKHEVEISIQMSNLNSETEKERTCLEKALHEEKEKLKSLQAALDNDESKTVFEELHGLSYQKFWKLNKFK